MNVYPPPPTPETRQEHNRLMNEAVIEYRIPLTLVCPDCYRPPRMCIHLTDPELECYRHKWPGEK